MFKPNPDAQGVPMSATCRWCGDRRVMHKGALLCHGDQDCDGVLMSQQVGEQEQDQA